MGCCGCGVAVSGGNPNSITPYLPSPEQLSIGVGRANDSPLSAQYGGMRGYAPTGYAALERSQGRYQALNARTATSKPASPLGSIDDTFAGFSLYTPPANDNKYTPSERYARVSLAYH